MASENLVCFAHGKESGPRGTKITHLAEVAKRNAFEVLSPDYSHTPDPRIRVRQLLELKPQARRLVLVGSSMGGYVSAQACAGLQPRGLFLIAPALYFPGWDEEPQAIPRLCTVVHGGNDDIVPVERGIRFAQRNKAELHLLDSGHTLNDQLPTLALLFEDLLKRVIQATGL
jgi:pimeloyl-ACP methyl ester carboxylesterase